MLKYKNKFALFGCFLVTAGLASQIRNFSDVLMIVGVILLAACVYFYGD